MSDETNIEAFERLADELLETPDVLITQTVGSDNYDADVSHMGDADAFTTLDDEHPAANVNSFSVTVTEHGPMKVAEAEFTITDPHEPFSISSAVSGTYGTPTTSTAEDGEDGAETAASSHHTPTTKYARPDETAHLKTPEASHEFVCGEEYASAVFHSISENYDSITGFLGDVRTCEACAVALAKELNLPAARLPSDLRREMGV